MKFTAWMPDADPSAPGTITALSNMVPTNRGYKVAPVGAPLEGPDALAAACQGATTIQKLNGTRRVFAGTTTAIFELSAGAWSDVATPVYTGGADNRWLFAQFGDATLATNDADQIQVSTSGNFAALATAPKAKILFTVPNFVIALNTQDASGSTAFGDQGDRWWCSGFQDHTVWTPALSTQCASGRLIGAGGPLTAGAQFGNGFVAYKEREMWLASYVGTPFVFQFDAVPGKQGCVGPEAVADIGNAHVFVGYDNIWLFDGSRPRSIADGTVREFFFANINPDKLSKTQVVYDQRAGYVWIFYYGVGATSYANSALVFHLTSGKWGHTSINAEAAFIYTEPGITWASVASIYSTWADMADITWDSAVWTAGSTSLAVFDATHMLEALSLSSGSGTVTTHRLGNATEDTNVRKVWPDMAAGAVDRVGWSSIAANGAGVSGGAPQDMNGFKATPNYTARLPRLTFYLENASEIMGFDVDAVSVGRQ